MREIRFRAWDKEKEKMILDFTNYAGWEAMGLVNVWNIDRYDKLQYTGLKDKNGKEIYEGDIIIYRDISGSGRPREFNPREVRWYRDSCNFNVSNPMGDAEVEVIGNVYENPELLK